MTEFAYHGVTTATTALSPEEWRGGWTPGHVERFAAPRGREPDAASFTDAIGRLQEAGHEPAMVIVDTAYTSDGILAPGPAYHEAIGAAARAAGAAGRRRRGASRLRPGRRPPVVVRRRRPRPRTSSPSASRWATATRSRPSSPAAATSRRSGARRSSSAPSPAAPSPPSAGLAVLDVIDDEGLVAHAAAMGELLTEPAARRHRATARQCATSAAAGCSSGSTWPARAADCGRRRARPGPRARRADRYDRAALRRPQDPAAAGHHGGPDRARRRRRRHCQSIKLQIVDNQRRCERVQRQHGLLTRNEGGR